MPGLVHTAAWRPPRPHDVEWLVPAAHRSDVAPRWNPTGLVLDEERAAGLLWDNVYTQSVVQLAGRRLMLFQLHDVDIRARVGRLTFMTSSPAGDGVELARAARVVMTRALRSLDLHALVLPHTAAQAGPLAELVDEHFQPGGCFPAFERVGDAWADLRFAVRNLRTAPFEVLP